MLKSLFKDIYKSKGDTVKKRPILKVTELTMKECAHYLSNNNLDSLSYQHMMLPSQTEREFWYKNEQNTHYQNYYEYNMAEATSFSLELVNNLCLCSAALFGFVLGYSCGNFS